MFAFGFILVAIGFITLILPSLGFEFVVIEAIAGLLGISSTMLSTSLIVLGFAIALVRAILGIFRALRARVTGSGRNEEQL
jgi:hypothetical protein